MRRLFAAGLLAIPIWVMGQSASSLPPLPEDLIPGLRPILVSALAQSPQMIARNIDIAQAEAGRIQSSAPLWPTISGSINYSENLTAEARQSGPSSTNSGVFYNLNLNQPVYHWGALKAHSDIGKIAVRIAGREYAEAYRQLVVSLRTQYLVLITKEIGLRNAVFALQQAETALALAEDKVKAKTLPGWGVIVPQMAVDEARLTRDRMASDLESSKHLFLLSAGQEDRVLKVLPDEVPQPTYAPEVAAELVRRFTQEDGGGTYAILNLRDYIRQAELDYRIARVQLRPKISINAGISQQNQTTTGAKQEVFNEQTYSVVANWTLFDGFATRGAKLAALSRKSSYERSLRTAADQAMTQVRDLEQQLGFSWRGLDLSQRRRDQGESGVTSAVEEVKRGLLSESDVDAARSYFYQTELNLAVARSDFLNLWSQFLSALCIDPMLAVIPDRYLQDGK